MLGLPDGVKALLFDLDGVLTQTAKVHQAAWKEMFDAFLRESQGDGFEEFSERDYERYVDGKPRYDGVRSFLESRGIEHDDALGPAARRHEERRRAAQDPRGGRRRLRGLAALPGGGARGGPEVGGRVLEREHAARCSTSPAWRR